LPFFSSSLWQPAQYFSMKSPARGETGSACASDHVATIAEIKISGRIRILGACWQAMGCRPRIAGNFPLRVILSAAKNPIGRSHSPHASEVLLDSSLRSE
jgi:hypothetical protein